jgi:serine/threonine-protein kinase
VTRVIAGKYEVLGVLGEGGTGVVYDAVTRDTGTPVALKVMHAHLAGEEHIRGRFRREAAILRRLEGPHICRVLDFGEAEAEESGKTLLYIAMEKLEGRLLEDVMKEGMIDVDRALDVMLEVCAALKEAHSEGVIHRDLKPANIFLRGGKDVVVVDFGMSKIVTGAGTGTTNLTAHNMVFGTPEYMSPEQARGDDLDARCDVYACGVILYEMLTGSPPFRGETPLNVLTAHLTSDLEPPSKRVKDGRVAPAIESVVLHALARDRDARYPSASALAAAIMHARAAPHDVASLRPATFATSPGTDAFAATLPAVSGPGSKPRVSDMTSATLPAIAPPLAPSKPPPASRIPSTKPSAKMASSPPRASSRPPPSPESTKTWIVLWVVAAIGSIGIGVYFALR